MTSSFNGMGNVSKAKVTPKTKTAKVTDGKQSPVPVKNDSRKGSIDKVSTDRGAFKFKNHNERGGC